MKRFIDRRSRLIMNITNRTPSTRVLYSFNRVYFLWLTAYRDTLTFCRIFPLLYIFYLSLFVSVHHQTYGIPHRHCLRIYILYTIHSLAKSSTTLPILSPSRNSYLTCFYSCYPHQYPICHFPVLKLYACTFVYLASGGETFQAS